MLWTSLGTAVPLLANTLIPPLPAAEFEPAGEETKDQRPSAVTATPNGSPGSADSFTSAAGNRAPRAVAVLQPGVRGVVVCAAAPVRDTAPGVGVADGAV